MKLDISQGLFPDNPLYFQVGQELEKKDLALLGTRALGSTPPQLKKIRQVHHLAAQLFASGAKATEISLATGLSLSRLSILRSDPTFKELEQFYTNGEYEAFTDFRTRMVNLSLDAAQEIHERLLDNPEEIDINELISIIKTAADRGGHAPVQRSERTMVTLSKEDLQEIKNATKGRNQVREKIIEGEVAKENPGASMGSGSSERSLPSPQQSETGSESKGADV